MKIISRSGSQTKKIAAELAHKILNAKPHTLNACVVALSGDLGAGKTTFAQGFANGLGIKHRIVSPTFLIFRRYSITASPKGSRGNIAHRKHLYHIDLYRIHSSKELSSLGFKSILYSPSNIVLIEWADKIKKILPKNTIWLKFEHGKKENERIIEIK